MLGKEISNVLRLWKGLTNGVVKLRKQLLELPYLVLGNAALTVNVPRQLVDVVPDLWDGSGKNDKIILPGKDISCSLYILLD